MHVSYGLHNLRISVSIEIGSFESRHFALYRYVFISVRQVYTESVFALFYKSTVFCCYCECTQINAESL